MSVTLPIFSLLRQRQERLELDGFPLPFIMRLRIPSPRGAALSAAIREEGGSVRIQKVHGGSKRNGHSPAARTPKKSPG